MISQTMQTRKINIISLLCSMILPFVTANGQSPTGTIRGIIKDSATGEVIAGASIGIMGKPYGVTTDDSGIFLLTGVPTGRYDLQVSFIGYRTLVIEGVAVNGVSESVLDITLQSAPEVMDEVTVIAGRHRGDDLSLLAEQKKSNLAIQRIGAQELSRKGVGDAATAVTKISGISKEDVGSQVYIRGLGDRYISTSLNGLPLPSNAPRLKNIALELFSTDVIEFIAVDKMYNVNMSGD